MSIDNTSLIAAIDGALSALDNCLGHSIRTARPQDRPTIAAIISATDAKIATLRGDRA